MEFTPRLEVASNASVPAFAPVVVLQYAGDFLVPFKKLYGSAVRLLHGSSDSRRHREVVRSDDCVFGHGWIFAEKDDSVVCEQSNGFVVTVLRYQIYSSASDIIYSYIGTCSDVDKRTPVDWSGGPRAGGRKVTFLLVQSALRKDRRH